MDSLDMIKVALDCYMGKDLQEDSNLSRPVKQALKDIEHKLELYNKVLNKAICSNYHSTYCKGIPSCDVCINNYLKESDK